MKIIPWWVFEKKYTEQFPSNMGQPTDSVRSALGSQIIKEKHQEFAEEAQAFLRVILAYFRRLRIA